MVRVRGGNGCNECPGRDRDMDLCWEGAVVQTCPPLKINGAGLKPKALSERKSGLEVWRTISQMRCWMVGRVYGASDGP